MVLHSRIEVCPFMENHPEEELMWSVAPTFDEFLYVNKLPRTLSYPKSRITVQLIGTISKSLRMLLEKEGYVIKQEVKLVWTGSAKPD